MRELLLTLLVMLGINIAVYIAGAFIAWNLNPMAWSLLTLGAGRFFLIVMEVLIFLAAKEIVEEQYW